MSASPLFSVIIPTYNRANLLKKAMQSVLSQIFQDWELIIVDDGSTDNTAGLVQSFTDNRIRYFFQEHQERSTARNMGITHASGKYVCFMDDDDYFLEDHLFAFYRAISEDGFPLKIYRNGYFIEKGRRRKPGPVYDENTHRNPVSFSAFNFCGAWTLCIPKFCLEEDTFPKEFPHWQDTHLILRLFAKYPFQQNEEKTYVYVHHPLMGSRSIYQRDDVEERIQSNVAAIKDFFNKYGNLVEKTLPQNTESYLVAKKYLDHADGALSHRKYSLAWKLFAVSLKQSRLRFLKWLYVKFLAKSPLLVLRNLLIY
ncbi:MAG: glycosyltransferase family 2 protein [Phaeodactylibacter sp.]|nr:glycosyltransferase family 2 protein [Phaeodactylibacter sp.]